MIKQLFFLLVLSLVISTVWAVDRNVAEFADAKQEQRYRLLLEELRCVVCQNQSLADSNAELAQDLRNEVRQMLDAGKTNQEIIDFLVSRYGDFVLYRPPFKSTTYVLWIGPLALLMLALGAMLYFIRRQKRPLAGDNIPLTEAEQEKLKRLLEENS